MVQPYSYGTLGRTEREYLPYARSGNNGAFVSNPLEAGNWSLYGTGDAVYAYTETEYDGTPMNRVVKKTGAGAAWHIGGKGVACSYSLNGENEVCLYQVDFTAGTLSWEGYYRAGSLQKVVTTDEDGHSVEVFTDNREKTILSVTVNGSERLETYYVYDDKGQLRWVLSPEASRQLSSSIDTDVLYQLAYYYEYDRLGRMTFKKLPGCEPIYSVYDKYDRLVLRQDGNMRAGDSKRWSYFVYDSRNREVERGEMVLATATTHAALIGNMMQSTVLPDGVKTALQYTRYDSYKTDSDVTPHAFVALEGYASDYHRSVGGLLTSTKSRVLGSDSWITTTVYYDEKCRPVQTVSNNLQGTMSYVNTVYDFVDNVTKRQEKHGSNTLETNYTYDDRGRLLTVSASLNGAEAATLAYGYDALGRLVSKQYGSNTVETYTYNVRGWLTGKESNAFRMKLMYEAPQAGSGARYAGDVAEWEWQQGTGDSQLYGFAYDAAGRLTETVHYLKGGTAWTENANAYTEKGITYDRNGNIMTLQRTANGILTDDLSYTYSGNRLTAVQGSSYEYDYNGNLTKDTANGLEFVYNALNLLQQVKENGTVKATYLYTADGTLLGVRDGTGNVGYDYPGSFVYTVTGDATVLEFAFAADGYLSADGMKYALTDHLGSTRVLVDESGTVVERNDYYPFGGRHENTHYATTGNRYLFGGMEMQPVTGKEIYNFGARMLDASLGCWMGVDPMAEKYYMDSPYNYCGNNPVNYIDLLGMDYWYTNDPGQIGAFLNNLQNGSWDSFDMSGWTHITDSDFASSLSYNDVSGIYYFSYGQVINGEPVITGVQFKPYIPESRWNPGQALGAAGLGATGQLADELRGSNSTYRLTNSKGNFDPRVYNNGWRGNQYVKTNKVATLGKVLKNSVAIFEAYNTGKSFYKTVQAYQMKSIDGVFENGLDATMGLIGFIPPYGSIISTYWSLGGKELHKLYTQKVILEQIRSGINPGFPTLQPFK